MKGASPTPAKVPNASKERMGNEESALFVVAAGTAIANSGIWDAVPLAGRSANGLRTKLPVVTVGKLTVPPRP